MALTDALSDRFKADLARYVAKKIPDGFAEDIEVTDFEDFTYYGGYCETCSYEDTYCELTYKLNGEKKTLEIYESFAELIKTLTYDYK